MAGDGVALRLDDVGAASKRYEVYGEVRLGPWRVPRLGNFLFLKYLPPVKRWGPYRELKATEWEEILALLAEAGARLTVAVTAGWVEKDGRVTPFPRRFPEEAEAIRQGLRAGLLEVANHGYTHCVLQDGLFRPRLFSGNRTYHREFYDWLPESVHREHVRRAQGILQGFFGVPIETLVPPGNVFSAKTIAAAASEGIRYISCLGAGRWGFTDGITFVDDSDVVAFHDRAIVLEGLDFLRELLAVRAGTRFLTVREVGQRRRVANAL